LGTEKQLKISLNETDVKVIILSLQKLSLINRKQLILDADRQWKIAQEIKAQTGVFK